MTGIAMASASGASVAAPIPPFIGSVSLQGNAGPFAVSGASGNIYAQGGAIISVGGSGGTPPYTFSVSIPKDGGTGSVSRVASGDGIHDTVGWSGMGIGDTVLFHISWSGHDSGSPQKTDNGRDPTNVAQTYSIQRTS